MLHTLATIWTPADTKLLDERGALLSTGAVFGTITLDRHLGRVVHRVDIPSAAEYSRSFMSREAADFYAVAIFNELVVRKAARVVASQVLRSAGARLTAMCAELRTWCADQGIELASADDLIHDGRCTGEQHGWLQDFIGRWQEAERDQHEAALTMAKS